MFRTWMIILSMRFRRTLVALKHGSEYASESGDPRFRRTLVALKLSDPSHRDELSHVSDEPLWVCSQISMPFTVSTKILVWLKRFVGMGIVPDELGLDEPP